MKKVGFAAQVAFAAVLRATVVPPLAVVAIAFVLPAAAGATVQPRTCGTLAHREQAYVIRAHVVSCSKAKRYARDYLVHRRRPAGWRCQRGQRTSKLAFRCYRSRAEIFAIRK